MTTPKVLFCLFFDTHKVNCILSQIVNIINNV